MYIPTRKVNIIICQINKPRWLAVLYKKCLFYILYIQTNIDDNNKKLKVPLWFISWGDLAVELCYVTSLLVVETTWLTFLSSSLRSKAHFCLHCSQVTGGPYFRSELAQRWHLLPMKAAIILQYSHAVGFP